MAVLALAAQAAAPTPTLEQMVRRAGKQAWPRGEAPAASGFFVDPSGVVLTSAHAVAGCKHILVGTKALAAPARLLAFDPGSDAALLHTAAPSPSTLALASSAPSAGERLDISGLTFASGTASDLQLSGVADGSQPLGGLNLLKIVDLERRLPDGASGSPVTNPQGVVVGMITGRLNGGGERAVAIPSVRLRAVMRRAGFAPRATQESPEAPARAAVAEVRCA